MNSGIADADEAGAAVAAALTDPPGATAAVERFDATRRDAAERNRTAAGRALAPQQAGPVGRLRQRLAAAVARWHRPPVDGSTKRRTARAAPALQDVTEPKVRRPGCPRPPRSRPLNCNDIC